MITEYTETGLEGLEGKTGLEGLEGKTGLEGFNSEPNKRLRFTPPLASRGAGIIIAARKCTEDERSESEGTFERSENPKGEPGVCERPRQNTGRQACAWRTEQGDGENWSSTA